MSRPVFWIVGGPNGSGKTTACQSATVRDAMKNIPILNPDDVALRELKRRGYSDFAAAADDELRDVFIAAANAVEAKVAELIARGVAFGVESVLSSDKYKSYVESVRAAGGFFGLIYVCTNDVEINVRRVRLRVSQGGHDVPEAKTRQRFGRSIENARWFLERADVGLVFDTSGSDGASPVQLVARTMNGVIVARSSSVPIADDLSNTLDKLPSV